MMDSPSSSLSYERNDTPVKRIKKTSILKKTSVQIPKEEIKEKLKAQTSGSILRNFAIAKKIRQRLGNPL
jgi:hypothetical protein